MSPRKCSAVKAWKKNRSTGSLGARHHTRQRGSTESSNPQSELKFSFRTLLGPSLSCHLLASLDHGDNDIFSSTLLLGELLPLVVADALDLGGRGGAWVKDESEPLLCQLSGELDSDDSLAEAEDLGVVGEDGALDGEAVKSTEGEWDKSVTREEGHDTKKQRGKHSRVHGGDGSDALDLVGGNGDTDTGTADKETSVCLSGLDLSGGLDGKVRVGCVARIESTHHGSDLKAIVTLLDRNTATHQSCQ